jgi:type I restriction enzyme, S subunit
MIKEDNNNLPENWILTSIGEIGIVVSGGTPSTRQPDFWSGDIPWITPADLSNYKDKYIQQGQRNLTKIGLENSSAKLLPKGSILFSSRAPIGYTVIAQNEIATNQGFKNLILTNSVYSDYIYYYLKHSKQLAESFASGTTFMELSATKFSLIPFPLPPLAEQYRIVEKIEELFSELDKAQESLLTAQKQLEIYRQMVLKDAFNDKLLKRIIVWESEKIENLTTKIVDGTHHTPEYTNKGVYFISVKDIRNRVIDFSNTKFISQKSHEELIKRCNPEKGDVLLTKSGTIGRLAIVPDNVKFSLFVSVALLKPKFNIVDSKYLMYSIENFINNIDIKTEIKGGVLKNFHLEDIKETRIPICSIEEQKQIVQEIEYRFTHIENLEKSVNENLKRVEIFRQTILQKAFSGKLVPQIETDEPASELLKRIKEEIRVYQIQQKIIAKSKPQKLVFMESNKTVKELLEEATEPMEAKKIWEKSIHKDDIEKFYEELKQLSDSIEVSFEGITSKLLLKK